MQRARSIARHERGGHGRTAAADRSMLWGRVEVLAATDLSSVGDARLAPEH